MLVDKTKVSMFWTMNNQESGHRKDSHSSKLIPPSKSACFFPISMECLQLIPPFQMHSDIRKTKDQHSFENSLKILHSKQGLKGKKLKKVSMKLHKNILGNLINSHFKWLVP